MRRQIIDKQTLARDACEKTGGTGSAFLHGFNAFVLVCICLLVRGPLRRGAPQGECWQGVLWKEPLHCTCGYRFCSPPAQNEGRMAADIILLMLQSFSLLMAWPRRTKRLKLDRMQYIFAYA